MIQCLLNLPKENLIKKLVMLYVLKNNLLYKFHLLLHLKNKTLLTIFLQFSFVLLYTYIYDTNHTYCMIAGDDAETSSAYGDPEDKYLKKSRKSLFQEILEIRSEEHTSELQSLMRISYSVFCLHKNIT